MELLSIDMKSSKTIGAISVIFYPPMVSDRTCREVDGDALSGRFLSQERECSFLAQSPETLQCQPLFSLTTYMYIFGNLNPTHRSIHLLSGRGTVPPKWTMFRPPWWLPQQPLPTTTINTISMTSNSFPPHPGTSSRKLSNAQAFAKMVWPVCKQVKIVSSNIIKCSCYFSF